MVAPVKSRLSVCSDRRLDIMLPFAAPGFAASRPPSPIMCRARSGRRGYLYCPARSEVLLSDHALPAPRAPATPPWRHPSLPRFGLAVWGRLLVRHAGGGGGTD